MRFSPTVQGVKADMKGVPWATARGSKEVMEDVEGSKEVKGGEGGVQCPGGPRGQVGLLGDPMAMGQRGGLMGLLII